MKQTFSRRRARNASGFLGVSSKGLAGGRETRPTPLILGGRIAALLVSASGVDGRRYAVDLR